MLAVRRLWLWLTAIALICAVAAAVALATSAAGTGHTAPRTKIVATLVEPLAAPPVQSWGLETAPQVAAVRRLAVYGLPLYCGASDKPMVALTFDDGPGVYTHIAIRKLREAHVQATFFLVGKEIHAWPGLAQREEPYAAFGDHTMTHPFLPALPRAMMVRQLAQAESLISRTVGEPVVLFRPPYEGRNRRIDREARALGMLEVLWNVDSRDSLGANYVGIERYTIAGLHAGSIVLMHENHGQTIRALPTILTALHRRHLEAVTVPELMAADPPSPAQLHAGVGGCPVTSHGGNGG